MIEVALSQPLEYTESFRSLAWEGLNTLYNGNFSQCHQIFLRLVQRYPNSPTPYLFLASKTWWQIYLDPTNTEYDDELNHFLDQALSIIDSYEEKERKLPENYILGRFIAYALKARLYAWRNSYFTASRYALKCLPAIEDNNSFQYFRYESYLGKGLYAYYREWYEIKHPSLKWILSLFPDGDMKTGINLMRQCAQQPNYMQIEAMVFLAEIFLFDEYNYNEAYKVTKQLILRYPDNPFFQYLHGLSCYYTSKSIEAYNIIRKAINLYPYSPNLQTPIRVSQSLYTSYLMARFYTLCLRLYVDHFYDTQEALNYLQKAEKTFSLLSFPPENEYGYFLFYKGLLLKKQGHCRESLSFFKQALEYPIAPDYQSKCKNILESGC